MATITGTKIEEDVRFLSQDEDSSAYRNSSGEILSWLNEATIALCKLVPSESTVTEGVSLVAGAKQTIPAKAVSLLSILRNLGVNGASPGTAITPTVRDMLDVFVPNWQNDAPSADIVHYMVDAANPKVFHVYPPSVVANQVEAVMAVAPATMTDLTEVIKVHDNYAPALVNYVLFRLYGKDTDDAANIAVATSYYNAFLAAAGVAA